MLHQKLDQIPLVTSAEDRITYSQKRKTYVKVRRGRSTYIESLLVHSLQSYTTKHMLYSSKNYNCVCNHVFNKKK